MKREEAFLAYHEALKQQRRVFDLRGERDRLRTAVDALERSFSWRLTSPLRALDSVCRGGARRVAFANVSNSGLEWAKNLLLRNAGPQLAIDVSRVIKADYGTGIQRVVRCIARSLVSAETAHCVALDIRGNEISDASTRLFSNGESGAPVSVRDFRRLLLLDGSWDIYQELQPLLAACRRAGIPSVTCVYDLIPLDFPETTSGDLPKIFRAWLCSSAENTDAFVCISEATARRLEKFLRCEYNGTLRAKKIGWWRLGSDLEIKATHGVANDFLIPPGPYVLSVGTFEPRKNQDFLLETFSKCWRERDYPASLVFAGRQGWKTEDLTRRIEEHPEFGRRLWWFRGVEDNHLKELYRRSSAVVMASSAEGFGLPVVEAARFGKPVVLSDISVFHEIVDCGGYFFTVNDSHSLCRALDEALTSSAKPTRAHQATWLESARELYGLIVDEKYQIRL